MDNPPVVRNLSQPKSSDIRGGLLPVNGWALRNPGDLREFVDEGLREATDVHPSFDSMEEVLRFMRGVGEYSERNSFFIDAGDGELQSSEGYFGEMYCGECVKDFVEELMSVDDPLDAEKDLDSDIHVYSNEEEVKSFRPGYDRFVEEVVYECIDHPEVSLEMRETWYDEQ